MENRRRYQRFSVDFLDISGRILFSTDIQVVNISVDGVCFSASKRLTPGKIYVLRLEKNHSVLFLEGTIVWTKINESTPESLKDAHPFLSGMNFIHTSDTQRRKILRFIRDNFADYQKLESRSPDTSGIRVYVRFHIMNPDRASIDCAEHYRVKRISQGGMLIESVNVFEIEDTVPMQMTLSEKKAVAFWGRIVTSQAVRDTDPKRYEMGIEFLDMSAGDTAVLKEFIASLENRKDSLAW